MERVKKFLKRILFLPPLPTVCIAVPAFALVTYVLITEIDGALSYLAYFASAYALILFVTGFPGIVWSVQRSITNHPLARKVLSTPASRRLVEDVTYRTKLSLYQGLAVNVLYIALKTASGFYYRSLWFGSLAVYYTLLAVMRFALLYQIRAEDDRTRRKIELQRYRLCGVVLLLMNQALAGIVVFMVHENRSYEYPGMLIYAMAAYSFYTITIAIVNVVKFRKHGSPVLSAAKAVNLVAALVSMLALETAMVAQFGGGEDPSYRKLLTESAGGGVCVIVLGMAVYMLVKSSKNMKQLNASSEWKGAN